MRFTRAGVDEESLFAAEEKIQERLLIIDAAVFPQNIEVGIVGVNLPFGRVITRRAARTPGLRKFTGANASAIGFRGLRPITCAP